MRCRASGCKGSLYCMDTRTDANHHVQTVSRRYCCAECGARYISLEVLNPIIYKFKDIPEGKLKSLTGATDG